MAVEEVKDATEFMLASLPNIEQSNSKQEECLEPFNATEIWFSVMCIRLRTTAKVDP